MTISISCPMTVYREIWNCFGSRVRPVSLKCSGPKLFVGERWLENGNAFRLFSRTSLKLLILSVLSQQISESASSNEYCRRYVHLHIWLLWGPSWTKAWHIWNNLTVKKFPYHIFECLEKAIWRKFLTNWGDPLAPLISMGMKLGQCWRSMEPLRILT
jgi:hypothetical protein